MNSTLVASDSSTLATHWWFIALDISLIVFIVLAMFIALIMIFTVCFDQTCRTVPMAFVGNTCLAALLLQIVSLWTVFVTLENDLERKSDYSFSCSVRAYLGYAFLAILNYSFFLQAFYRYMTVVYSSRLFWRSSRNQALIISFSWIVGLIHPIPAILIDQIVYNRENQVCQIPLRLHFSIIYLIHCIYVIPNLLITTVYLKLVRYVRQISQRVTPANVLSRARKELKMIRRTVILISILVALGFPYAVFLFMSFFTAPPVYHFRIAFIFMFGSLTVVMMVLFHFTEPVKLSLIKHIRQRRNLVEVIGTT